MFEYECPHCCQELRGGIGDNVYCDKCDKSYETDWDYTNDESMGAWLTGMEYDGIVDIY